MSKFIKWEKQFKKAGSCLTYGLDSFWVSARGRRHKWTGTEEISKLLEKEGVCQLCHLEGKMGKDHIGALLFCFPVGEGHLHCLPCSPAGSFSLLYPTHGACPMDFWWKVTCPFRGFGTGRPVRSLPTQTSWWLYDHDWSAGPQEWEKQPLHTGFSSKPRIRNFSVLPLPSQRPYSI